MALSVEASELVEIFQWQKQDEYQKNYVKKNKIRHQNNENLAVMHLQFVREIIQSIRAEVGNGGLVSSDKIINGAGRLAKGSPLYKAYVENDGSMKALLISLVTSDSFLYRKVQ